MRNDHLDPEITAFIDRYTEVSGLSTETSISQQRVDYGLMLGHFQYPHPAGLETSDEKLAGRHGPIPVRHYRYLDGDDSALVMFVHGGGFILGDLDSHDDICAEICARTGYNLVSIDYRLSPEFQHPVHLDDIEDAFNACAHPNTVLVGVSAGGTLCAALCHRLRKRRLKPEGQVLIYAGLGGDCFDLGSYRHNASAPLLTAADVHFFRAVRCQTDDLPVDDPEFYPLVADDFSQLPQTLAFSADVDPLRDDTKLYVDRLKLAGVAAEWINEIGLVHDYLRARHVSQLAAAAFTRICNGINRLCRGA